MVFFSFSFSGTVQNHICLTWLAPFGSEFLVPRTNARFLPPPSEELFIIEDRPDLKSQFRSRIRDRSWYVEVEETKDFIWVKS